MHNETIKRMKANAQCYNRYLTDKYLSELTTKELLQHCNPRDRLDFIRELVVANYEQIKEQANGTT